MRLVPLVALALLCAGSPVLAASKACKARRCTIPGEVYARIAVGCKTLWSSPDDNAVAMGCTSLQASQQPKTCRIIRYDCDDLGASLLGITPNDPTDDYIVSFDPLQ